MSWEAAASIPTEPWEWPEVVVRGSLHYPELGTEANPIVIEDDHAPLGSASNPIVIEVDEGLYHGEAGQPDSDADTETMTTPEFWENLIDESYRNTASGIADVEPTSVRGETGPPSCDDPPLQVLDKLVSDCARLDKRAKDLAESIPGVAENCSSPGIATCGQSATGNRESGQDVQEDNILNAEPTTFDNVTEASLTDSDTITNGPTDPTDGCLSRKELSFRCSAARTKRKLSCVKEVPVGLRRSERLIKRARH